MKKEVKHQPWCAKIIAINNATPWNVRCDCQRKKIKYCRLYKYTCSVCGKERHKRHSVKSDICNGCTKQLVNENQASLFN